MKADDGKRCTYVSLFSLPPASRPEPIRVYPRGCWLPYRLGFYDPFFGLPMFWNPTTGQFDSVGKDGRSNSGDAHWTS